MNCSYWQLAAPSLSVLARRAAQSSGAVFLAVAVSACGASGLPQDVVAALGSGIDHIAAENETHHAAVSAATSAPAIVELENDHRVRRDAAFDAIRSAVEKLYSSCTVRSLVPLDTSGVHDALQDVSALCDRHDIAMRATTDVGELHAEEARHTTAMRDDLNKLRAQRDTLLSRASGADCK